MRQQVELTTTTTEMVNGWQCDCCGVQFAEKLWDGPPKTKVATFSPDRSDPHIVVLRGDASFDFCSDACFDAHISEYLESEAAV